MAAVVPQEAGFLMEGTMKRLLILALVAFAAWYGWHHYQELLQKTPKHEAVIVNHSGEVLTRVRLTVGGQTYVKEEMANGESASAAAKGSDWPSRGPCWPILAS